MSKRQNQILMPAGITSLRPALAPKIMVTNLPEKKEKEKKKEPKGKYADILNEFIAAGFTRAMLGDRVGVSEGTIRRYLAGEFTEKTEKLMAKAFENVPMGLKRADMYRYMCPETNLEHMARGKSTEELIEDIMSASEEMKDGDLVSWMLSAYEGFKLSTIEKAILKAYPDSSKLFGETYMYSSKAESGMFAGVPEDMSVADILKTCEED